MSALVVTTRTQRLAPERVVLWGMLLAVGLLTIYPQAGADTTQRDFTVPFDFDSDYLTLHTTRIVGEAARVAKAVSPAKIEVNGYRATTWLSNGRKFIEAQTIAEKRAKKIGEILVGLGLPTASVSVNWKGEPEACDGVTDPDKRRVTIKIIL